MGFFQDDHVIHARLYIKFSLLAAHLIDYYFYEIQFDLIKLRDVS